MNYDVKSLIITGVQKYYGIAVANILIHPTYDSFNPTDLFFHKTYSIAFKI
jgi:hypothetical protein